MLVLEELEVEFSKMLILESDWWKIQTIQIIS